MCVLPQKKRLQTDAFYYVHPKGLEPLSQEPESCILSVELRVRSAQR